MTALHLLSFAVNQLYKTIYILNHFALILLFLGPDKPIYSQSTPDLLFVQIPDQLRSVYSTDDILKIKRDRYTADARIVIRYANVSEAINLTPDFFAACDPDVSSDGNRIVFAGKKRQEDCWQIWKMNIDGTQLQQISHGEGDCITPVYAGNRFYLDDPQPTPQIIYAGTSHGWKEVKDNKNAYALYGMDTEGKTVQRLTYNLESDFSPDILPNGRIAFISWQNKGNQSQVDGNYVFMAVNNDGTDLMPFYGNHETPVYKDMVHISDFDQRIYYIESERLFWLGGGDICLLSKGRPLHSYRRLTPIENGLYHSPCPLPDGGLLASYRSLSQNSVFALYLVDVTTGKKTEKIYEQSGWHCIDTQVLKPRPKAKGRSNWLIPGKESGIFYCLNSYRTNLPELADMDPGTAKYVRVIEGIPHLKNFPMADDQKATNGPSYSDSSFKTIYGSKRILGIAPIEEDGSFQIRVPAETPLNFQLLDKNYLAVRTQNTWTWVMGNENRGCIGCHEDPEMAPPNILVKAVTKPAVELTLPAERRRKIDFLHQIAPIIESKCATAQCHISGKAKPNLEISVNKPREYSLRQIYKILVDPGQNPRREQYVIPGNAKGSSLIRHLLGEKFEYNNTPDKSDVKLVSINDHLDLRSEILFIEWIDLGAYWDYPE